METKHTMGTILYTKYHGQQKCTLFHFLATFFLATFFANHVHNSLLDEKRCTQMHQHSLLTGRDSYAHHT